MEANKTVRNQDYLCDFLAQRKAEGWRLNKPAWRKLIRELSVRRKYEKRLNRELHAIGASEDNNAPTDLKFKIMFLEDFRRSMYGQRIAQRTYVRTRPDPVRTPIHRYGHESIFEYLAQNIGARWGYEIFRTSGHERVRFSLIPNPALKLFPGMPPHDGWAAHWHYACELGIVTKDK